MKVGCENHMCHRWQSRRRVLITLGLHCCEISTPTESPSQGKAWNRDCDKFQNPISLLIVETFLTYVTMLYFKIINLTATCFLGRKLHVSYFESLCTNFPLNVKWPLIRGRFVYAWILTVMNIFTSRYIWNCKYLIFLRGIHFLHSFLQSDIVQ